MDMRMNRLWVRGHLLVTASGRSLPVLTDRNRPKADGFDRLFTARIALGACVHPDEGKLASPSGNVVSLESRRFYRKAQRGMPNLYLQCRKSD